MQHYLNWLLTFLQNVVFCKKLAIVNSVLQATKIFHIKQSGKPAHVPNEAVTSRCYFALRGHKPNRLETPCLHGHVISAQTTRCCIKVCSLTPGPSSLDILCHSRVLDFCIFCMRDFFCLFFLCLKSTLSNVPACLLILSIYKILNTPFYSRH